MMDERAMFSLTYGLFVVSCANGACMINTAQQVTSEPVKMTLTMLKSNNTTSLIKKNGTVAVSVLSDSVTLDTIAAFGMRSGRDHDKLAGFEIERDSNGNAYLTKDTLSMMSLRVCETKDLGTHYLFICDVTEAKVLSEGNPMTYKVYRDKKAKRAKSAAYVCSICHYIYDGDIPFEELGEDYVCPVCFAPKSVFVKE